MSGYAFVDDVEVVMCDMCERREVVKGSDLCKRCKDREEESDRQRKERANTIQFGKYKGKTFSWIVENDKSYAKWLLKQQEERHFNFSPRGLPDWMEDQNLERERISNILTKLGVTL